MTPQIPVTNGLIASGSEKVYSCSCDVLLIAQLVLDVLKVPRLTKLALGNFLRPFVKNCGEPLQLPWEKIGRNLLVHLKLLEDRAGNE